MSGHSKWSSIKHKKGAKDAKRGKIFPKLIREVTVAAKSGEADPAANPRLRTAIQAARSQNMPLDTVMRAVKKGAGGNDGVDYEEITYEGYGPYNAAVVVEALTDNRNRTASSIRATFTKYNGNLGSSNSVTFMFDRQGLILIDKAAIDETELTEHALEAGAEDLDASGDDFAVLTTINGLEPLKSYLEAKGIDYKEAQLIWAPQTKVVIDDKDHASKVLNFLEALEDDDDVQRVFTNFEIADSLLEQMSA